VNSETIDSDSKTQNSKLKITTVQNLAHTQPKT